MTWQLTWRIVVGLLFAACIVGYPAMVEPEVAEWWELVYLYAITAAVCVCGVILVTAWDR